MLKGIMYGIKTKKNQKTLLRLRPCLHLCCLKHGPRSDCALDRNRQAVRRHIAFFNSCFTPKYQTTAGILRSYGVVAVQPHSLEAEHHSRHMYTPGCCLSSNCECLEEVKDAFQPQRFYLPSIASVSKALKQNYTYDFNRN